MNTATMTRAQFMAEYRRAHTDGCMSDAHMALLAERAGVEWVPEAVDPVVGELLTEQTRPTPGLVAVDAEGDAWQADGVDGRMLSCARSEVSHDTPKLILHYGPLHIVYVPDVASSTQPTGSECS